MAARMVVVKDLLLLGTLLLLIMVRPVPGKVISSPALGRAEGGRGGADQAPMGGEDDKVNSNSNNIDRRHSIIIGSSQTKKKDQPKLREVRT